MFVVFGAIVGVGLLLGLGGEEEMMSAVPKRENPQKPIARVAGIVKRKFPKVFYGSARF